MQHLMEGLASTATNFITHFGIWGVFLGMLLESACIPLPSELIMPFAGYLAGTGQFTLFEAAAAGILGNLAGSWIAFEVGRWGGRPLIERYGRYIYLSEKHLETAERWFARYGEWAVFFGRVLPVIRTFISLPAGIAKMNRAKFLLFTLLGCIPWCFLLAYVGLSLGAHWDTIRTHLHSLDYPMAFLVLIGLVWFWIRNRKRG